MKLNPEILHLGEITMSEIKFSTQLINDSDTQLVISSVVPGCGSCTNANLGNFILAPGQSTSLVCKFNPQSTGYNAKVVRINAESGDSVEFKFTANVTY